MKAKDLKKALIDLGGIKVCKKNASEIIKLSEVDTHLFRFAYKGSIYIPSTNCLIKVTNTWATIGPPLSLANGSKWWYMYRSSDMYPKIPIHCIASVRLPLTFKIKLHTVDGDHYADFVVHSPTEE